MASHSQGSNLIFSTSPKSDGGSGGSGGNRVASLFKGQQCLCSPTTHEGSFRCRFHRLAGSSNSSTSPWMKRSKSMPANKAT
ncbi:hypothetical protein Lal_00003252 [Lupinus albus]|uniref:Uncharacterized protein n=1 Tax=Lupinus albus TaxID=3870 RepID=A0A6A5NJJ5_LUPAL|nr:hypothetical protein Lalb_Chr22g0352831 [Lupinus albus]KAF1883070.1 hypothetical protein Lal_00003252 [Lupinus albus]